MQKLKILYSTSLQDNSPQFRIIRSVFLKLILTILNMMSISTTGIFKIILTTGVRFTVNCREQAFAKIGVKIFVARHLINFFPFCFSHLCFDGVNCLLVRSHFLTTELNRK